MGTQEQFRPQPKAPELGTTVPHAPETYRQQLGPVTGTVNPKATISNVMTDNPNVKTVEFGHGYVGLMVGKRHDHMIMQIEEKTLMPKLNEYLLAAIKFYDEHTNTSTTDSEKKTAQELANKYRVALGLMYFYYMPDLNPVGESYDESAITSAKDKIPPALANELKKIFDNPKLKGKIESAINSDGFQLQGHYAFNPQIAGYYEAMKYFQFSERNNGFAFDRTNVTAANLEIEMIRKADSGNQTQRYVDLLNSLLKIAGMVPAEDASPDAFTKEQRTNGLTMQDLQGTPMPGNKVNVGKFALPYMPPSGDNNPAEIVNFTPFPGRYTLDGDSQTKRGINECERVTSTNNVLHNVAGIMNDLTAPNLEGQSPNLAAACKLLEQYEKTGQIDQTTYNSTDYYSVMIATGRRELDRLRTANATTTELNYAANGIASMFCTQAETTILGAQISVGIKGLAISLTPERLVVTGNAEFFKDLKCATEFLAKVGKDLGATDINTGNVEAGLTTIIQNSSNGQATITGGGVNIVSYSLGSLPPGPYFTLSDSCKVMLKPSPGAPTKYSHWIAATTVGINGSVATIGTANGTFTTTQNGINSSSLANENTLNNLGEFKALGQDAELGTLQLR